MAFCSNCGKEVNENARFCPYCGAERGVNPAAAAEAQDVENNKVMAVLAYIGILVLVPILAAKESRFARYHANQGLVLFIAEIVVGIVVGIVRTGMAFVGLGLIGHLLGWAFNVLCLLLMVLGIINAAKGALKELPVLGKIAILN